MEYFIRGLSSLIESLITSVIIYGIFTILRRPKRAKKGKVYLPKFFLIFGVITSIIFLIPTIITAFSDESIWTPIIFLTFSLISSFLIIAFVNCRISYDEDTFVSKNFFGIKRKFTYDQITAIKENMHETYIYIWKRRVMIDEFSVGGAEFIKFVRKKYRTIHNGQDLPEIRKIKHDIFNGNVNNVAGFIFVYISMGVIIVAFAVCLACHIFTPSTIYNTIEQQVKFESCVINGDEIKLTSSNGQIYKIRFTDEQFNADTIQSICNGETVVTTYSKEITSKDGNDYFSVKAILYDDAYLLSFDKTNSLHRQEGWPLLFFPVIFAILWGAFVAGSIIVGRNPKKYSKKVVNLFFKDGYIKY